VEPVLAQPRSSVTIGVLTALSSPYHTNVARPVTRGTVAAGCAVAGRPARIHRSTGTVAGTVPRRAAGLSIGKVSVTAGGTTRSVPAAAPSRRIGIIASGNSSADRSTMYSASSGPQKLTLGS
jgi:hypothetical protein